jgi:hypothetical protein
MANPAKRKKQLPRFLTGWFSRARDPKPWAAGQRQGNLDLSTEAGREQARRDAGWE